MNKRFVYLYSFHGYFSLTFTTEYPIPVNKVNSIWLSTAEVKITFAFKVDTQPVLYNWCDKGCGICYPVFGVEYIMEGRKEMVYLTTHSIHFYLRLYGVWLGASFIYIYALYDIIPCIIPWPLILQSWRTGSNEK